MLAPNPKDCHNIKARPLCPIGIREEEAATIASFTYSRLTPSALPVHSDNDVVESAWRVDAGFAWHAVRIAEHDRVGKLYF